MITGSAPMEKLDPTARITPFLDAGRQRALQAAIRDNLNLRTLKRWRDVLERDQGIHEVDLSGALGQFDEACAFVVPAYRLS